MKHWKTKEEMGEGFQFNKAEHSEIQYNALLKIEPHEENIMRTFYLVRDWWHKNDLIKLRDFINEQIKERSNG
tara:strand:+ start:279 stop:497 length:219 start_codon:yes stop_codon:yes gene_type:complete